MQATRSFKTKAVIANGATKSNAVLLSPNTLVGVLFPSEMTGTTISFEVCDTENGTFSAVNNGGAYTITKANSAIEPVASLVGNACLKWVKIVSNATELAERTLYFITRDIS
jgi:hypothetical protein